MEHAKYSGHRWVDQDGREKVALYHAGAVVVGTPYLVSYDATYGECAIAPATETTHHLNKIVVALESSAAGEISVFQEGGPCDVALVYTAASGDFLEVLNTGTYFVCDGSSGSTTRSIKSAAKAMAANTAAAAAATKIYLFNYPHDIAAS